MQTIQFKVDNNYIEIVLNLLNSLNSLKMNVINDLLVIDKQQESNLTTNNEYQKELKSFSNHTANLIEEWKDSSEDSVWI